MLRYDLDPRRIRRNQEERDTRAVTFGAGAARGDDQGVGGACVEHLDLLTVEPITVAARRRPCCHRCKVVTTARLLVRDAEKAVARRDGAEPITLLRLVPGRSNEATAQEHRR